MRQAISVLNPEPGGFSARSDAADWLVVMLPRAGDTATSAWQIRQGQAFPIGEIPLASSAGATDGASRIVALASVADCVLRWHALDAGLAPRQAEAAARLEIGRGSIAAPDELHVAARRGADGVVVTASIGAARLAEGIARLADAGLEPDAVLPAGLIVPEPKAGLLRAAMGGETLLRGKGLCLPDEAPLKAALAPHLVIEDLSGDACIAAIARLAEAAPPLDLRCGPFARRMRFATPSPAQWRGLGLILALALAFALATALVDLIKLRHATNLLQAPASQAGAHAGAAADRKSRFGLTAASLFAELRAAPGVSLSGLDYRNGVLTASLNAPRDKAAAIASRLEAKGFRAGLRGAQGRVELVIAS